MVAGSRTHLYRRAGTRFDRNDTHQRILGSWLLAPGYVVAKDEPVILACSAWVVHGLRRFRQISSSPVCDHGPGVVTSPPGWMELSWLKGVQGRLAFRGWTMLLSVIAP